MEQCQRKKNSVRSHSFFTSRGTERQDSGRGVAGNRIVNTDLKNIGIIQGGITCGAIDEPRQSSKAIDERVIINFRDKNVLIARFRDKNVVIARFRDKNVVIVRFRDKNVVILRIFVLLSIAFLFRR